ncbi:unnamed protein product [Mytilus coruscus]|uniref:Uncharacterized protein n=1 Tax=Mytilus coruscus TaxID=42192 RepID=A0A6J8E8D0_MYTCO|nr:unnamed protein product [Mytilus coruscus]
MNNTRLELDIMDDEIPSSQQSPPRHRIILISFDIGSLDEDCKGNIRAFYRGPETEKYFDNKVSEFNRKIRREFREHMLDGAKEVVNTVAKDIETIWRDACTKLDNGHKESGKNISKLNDRIMEMKTKWAAEYQKAAGIPEKQERRAEHKAGTKDKSEISELKRELDDLKKELDRNKEFRYYRGGHRGRRFNHQYRHYSY